MGDKNQAESSSSKLNLKSKISMKTNKKPIPKTLEAGPSNNNKNHVSKECSKRFSSYKALGGHESSAHVQAQSNKDLSQNKLKSNKKINLCVRCEICAREFQSDKALFGHLKSHPERRRRGMDPPQDDEKSEDSSDDDDLLSFSEEDEDVLEQEENLVDYVGPITDLRASLKGWGATGKRGRVEPNSEPEEDELHVGVRQLIRMLDGPIPKKAYDVSKNRASGSGPDKMVVGETHELGGKSMSISLDDRIEIGRKAKHVKVDDKITGSGEKLRPPTIKEKVLDRSFGPNPTSTLGKDKVFTCDKSFSTFQASGGHISSPNKPRASFSNTVIEVIDVDTYKFGSSSKAKTASVSSQSKLFDTGNGGPNRRTNLVDMVISDDQVTTGNESTQGSSVNMIPCGSQATFGNGSTQGCTTDRVSSRAQANSANVRTQVPEPKVFLDLNQFPDEDET